MIQYTRLEMDTSQFLQNKKAKDTDETATFLGESYYKSMKIAVDPRSNLVVLKDVDILINAWKKVFAVQLASPKDLKSIPYNFIGAAMIKFWTGTVVSPLIPAAAENMLSGITNFIVFPGNPIPVGKGIYDAFKKMKAPLVAGALVKVYKDHAKSIQGIHNGLTINPGPSTSATSIPVVVPWNGLK
jgi:hypothetical protein